MTAPKTCERCGAHLDAGEICTCTNEEYTEPAAGSMEFVMGNSLETLPETIDFNFEELKAQLAENLEPYANMVVTADTIKAAKEDRARLNKLREALETKRKEVKKECMAPYLGFEARVKELVGLIDQSIAVYDGQLKGFEEKRRAEKRAAVLAVYEDTIGELRALLPFDKLWRNEWYNAGVSMKKIREAIVAAEDKAASDLDVLATVESEFVEAVKLKYLEELDLNAALAERVRLQEQAKRLREYEEQRRAAAAQEASAPPPAPAPAPESVPEEPVAEDEEVYLLRFECQVTMEQAAELAAWLKDRNIPYRRVKSWQ